MNTNCILKSILLVCILCIFGTGKIFAQTAATTQRDSTTVTRQDSATRSRPASNNSLTTNVSRGTPNVLINNAGFSTSGTKTSGFISNGSSVQPVIVHPGPNIMPAGIP